jgi:hypothetical protein
MIESKKGHKRFSLPNHFWVVGVLGLLVFAWSQAEAARPLTTDDAGTVGGGAFELEMGYDFSRDEDHTQNQSLGVSIKHGLIQRLDLCLALPYQIQPDEEFGDAQIGIKYLLSEETGNLPAFSLTLACESGRPDCALTGIASREIGDLALHINLGYMASGLKGEDGVMLCAGAIECALSKSSTLVAELVGELDSDENALEALVGGNYRISEQVVLDLGIGRGFNTVSAKEGKATLGLTYGF